MKSSKDLGWPELTPEQKALVESGGDIMALTVEGDERPLTNTEQKSLGLGKSVMNSPRGKAIRARVWAELRKQEKKKN